MPHAHAIHAIADALKALIGLIVHVDADARALIGLIYHLSHHTSTS